MRSVKEYFSFLNKVYISTLVIPCLFLAFAVVTTISDSDVFSENDVPYIILDGVVMLLGFFAAYYYSQKKIKESQRKRGLREKVSLYRKASFIIWFVVSNIAIFSIGCYIITGEHFFVCSTIFSLVILLLNRPGARKLIQKLDLAEDEQRVIENPKSAI